MAEHQRDSEWNVAEWHGKMLVHRDSEKIGELHDVYVDVETDEPQFGTVKEGLIGRHLTFVPFGGITVGPDTCRWRSPGRTSPNIEQRRGALPVRRVGPLPPLRAQLHPAQHGERTPARAPLIC